VTFNRGEQFEVVTVSFDPRETPEARGGQETDLRQGLQPSERKPAGTFSTGDEANIKRLTMQSDFATRGTSRAKQFAHASGIMVRRLREGWRDIFTALSIRPRT
jgi:protein SCO1/2